MLIGSGGLFITFDEKDGAITSIKNIGGKEFFKMPKNPLPLFKIGLIESGEEKIYCSDNSSFKYIFRDGKALFNYEGIGGKNLNASVEISDKNGLLSLNLSIENNTGYIMEYTDFPCITVPRDLQADGGNSKLFWPAMEGVLIDDLNLREKTFIKYAPIGDKSKGWEGFYPGACPMQFMAYYGDGGGLYIASHDEDGNAKGIEFCAYGDDSVYLQYRLFAGTSEKNVMFGYDMVFAAFEGDWHDAADIYAKWLKTTKLLNIPKLEDNKEVASWLYESPIVAIYCVRGVKDTGDMSPNMYYPYTNALPYIKQLNTNLDSKIMALLMHWEGSAPWAPPYVWPPFGDMNNFSQFAEKLHLGGNYLGIYCSGIGWTQQSSLCPEYNKEKDFEKLNLKEYMCRSRDNKLGYSNICNGPIRWGYDLCPSCGFTQETVLKEIEKIISQGNIDYVQFFDQNLGGQSYLCYADNHGHPPVPGKWQTESMKAIFKQIKGLVERKGFKGKLNIGCEAAPSETFLNDLYFNDLRYIINFMCGVPVPAYNYLFHEYVQNFMGNQNTSFHMVDFEKYPETIFFRFAYSFAQGDTLTVVLKDNGKIHWDWCTPWDVVEVDQEKIIYFIKILNGWRNGWAKEFLFFGKMKKPLTVKCGEYIVEQKPGGKHILPGIVSTRFCRNGKDVQFLINYRNFNQKAEISGISCESVQIISDSQGNGYIKQIQGGKLELELNARDVIAIILNK